MKIPYLTRLMEIKEEQLRLENHKARMDYKTNGLLMEILKELKGGLKKMEFKIKDKKESDVCEIWLEKNGERVFVNSMFNGEPQIELIFERGIKRLPIGPSSNISMKD